MTKTNIRPGADGGIVIEKRALRALLVTAAKNDIRFYLGGIQVETDDRDVILVSTDGHRIGAMRMAKDASVERGMNFIMPRDLVESVRGSGWARIRYADKRVSIDSDGLTVSAFALDGKFPDWRKLFANTPSGERAKGFNVAYIADFQRVAALLGGGNYYGSGVRVIENGNAGAIVLIGHREDYVGVVMPMNLGDQAPPSWIRAKTEPAADAAVKTKAAVAKACAAALAPATN